MKQMAILRLFHLTLLFGSALAATYSLTDLCQISPIASLVLYGTTEHTFTLSGRRTGLISSCTLFVKNPPVAGNTLELQVKFEGDYNVGYDAGTRQPRTNATDRGLRVYKSKQYVGGSTNIFWTGLKDSTGVVGNPLIDFKAPRANGGTSATILIIVFKGTLPDDKLTMKMSLTCTPGPCPSSPPPTTPTSPRTTPITKATTKAGPKNPSGTPKVRDKTTSSACGSQASILIVATGLWVTARLHL